MLFDDNRGIILFISSFSKAILRPKEKICVSSYISRKIRVGRSLLSFYFFYNFNFSFSLILPKNTTDALFAPSIYIYITKRGLFLGLFTYNT